MLMVVSCSDDTRCTHGRQAPRASSNRILTPEACGMQSRPARWPSRRHLSREDAGPAPGGSATGRNLEPRTLNHIRADCKKRTRWEQATFGSSAISCPPRVVAAVSPCERARRPLQTAFRFSAGSPPKPGFLAGSSPLPGSTLAGGYVTQPRTTSAKIVSSPNIRCAWTLRWPRTRTCRPPWSSLSAALSRSD
jgi:hypothetical protein